MKRRFSFRLATTSFIYPAGWAENVRHLASLVDEIELLFFESTPGSLPSTGEIVELVRLGRELDVGFDVHLPLDVCLGDGDAGRRRTAAGRLAGCMTLCRPLAPSSYTLHLSAEEKPGNRARWQSWRQRCRRGVEALLETGVDSRLLAVETLIYPPFELAETLVEEYDLSVCLDMGHLLMRGQSPLDFFNRLKERITIVHLHGVAEGHDHLGLDRLPASRLDEILKTLSGFTGTVSLEVFSRKDLQTSLLTLEKWLAVCL
jgi:sugar phosphate isomerase/epimerase